MKKEFGITIIFLCLILLSSQLVFSANNSIGTSNQQKIDKAYDCLRNKIDSKECDSLSIEEQIFSLLAVGKCKNELEKNSKNDKCWPEDNCNIQTTAQAVLALNNKGANTADAEEWLLEHSINTPDVIWYLQIESPKKTSCDIKYENSNYEVIINSDKKFTSGAGSCLSKTEDGYWLRISKDCFEKEFTISCDNSFITSLLFKKKTSSTIHVLPRTHSASGNGTTTEIVNSTCFSLNKDSCDYIGSLWSAITLDNLDYKTTSYMPYLISGVEDNRKYLPESFLYFLTGYSDLRNTLLLRQKGSYWEESGDKYYDTAIALYSLYYDESDEKENAKQWLLENQEDNGCWQNNIKNTAFLLYSVWPRGISSEGSSGTDMSCENSGYYCMSSINCEGEILSAYDCPGTYKCCDIQETGETCIQQGGEICSSEESCIGGTTLNTPNLEVGEICCFSGSCEVSSPTINECEEQGGICKTFCSENEEKEFYSCEYSSDSCCFSKSSKKEDKSYWWLWLLIILIILVILAIIFRDKLRPYYYRIKAKISKKFDKGNSGKGSSRPAENKRPGPPGMPPGMRRPFSRRIVPPSQRPKKRANSKNSEIDDVLKKLKEMGK